MKKLFFFSESKFWKLINYENESIFFEVSLEPKKGGAFEGGGS